MRRNSASQIPNGWSWPFSCGNCGRAYVSKGFPYRCPACGGIYNFSTPLRYAPIEVSKAGRAGLERFRHSFPLPFEAQIISLGEGDTPLLGYELRDRKIYFKCEYLNPTGSFKDRGTFVLMSALCAAGVEAAVEDSSGNAGASFAAYAARAGIGARVIVPEYASGPKRAQIEAYGAKVVCVPGPRSAATEAVRREAEAGAVYASHGWLPHGIAGMATVAFEIYEQLGEAPGSVVLPVGQGSLFLGIFLGYKAMMDAGAIDRLPAMIGVQAGACAPIWAVYSAGAAGLELVREGETVAEGIRILHPHRGDEILAAVDESGGEMVAVEEESILESRNVLSRLGLYVEPTSAVVWPALEATLQALADPVVVVLTGSGLKSFSG
jgi:threonine synthase